MDFGGGTAYQSKVKQMKGDDVFVDTFLRFVEGGNVSCIVM